MPRFEISKAFSLGGLGAYLRLGAGLGEGTPEDPSEKVPRLEKGLRAARGASQKRAKRVAALRSRVEELQDARAEDGRMLRYLLSDAFERRGPWVTGVEVDERVYGRATRHNSPRLREFFEAFPEASRGRVLEPGSLEGAMTVELARRAREVVGIEARPESVERAEFLKGLFGAESASFHTADLEEEDLASHGEFDAVFCCGLLYHLRRPRAFVQRLAAVSPNLYLDTQYAPPEWGLTQREGLWGWVREEDPGGPQSGLYDTAFWPTLQELYRLLFESGYESVQTLALPPDNRYGPRARIAACRSRALP